MSEEQRYNDLLRKLDKLEIQIVDIKKDIISEMQIKHIKFDNRVSNVEKTVKEHRNIFVTIISVVGLGILAMLMKVIGIDI